MAQENFVREAGERISGVASTTSFFGSPSTWSAVLSGVASGLNYGGSSSGAKLAFSIGGFITYIGNGYFAYESEKDYKTTINEIHSDNRDIVKVFDSGINTVTLLSHEPDIHSERGYYLHRSQGTVVVTIISKVGERTQFRLNNADIEFNILLQLINREEPGEREVSVEPKIIGNKLGMALTNLIESHSEYPPESFLNTEEQQAEMIPAGYFSARQLMYYSNLALQVCAIGLSLYEIVGYSIDVDRDDNRSVVPPGYILGATIFKTISTLTSLGMTQYQEDSVKNLQIEFTSTLKERANRNGIAAQKLQVAQIVNRSCGHARILLLIRQQINLAFEQFDNLGRERFKTLHSTNFYIFCKEIENIINDIGEISSLGSNEPRHLLTARQALLNFREIFDTDSARIEFQEPLIILLDAVEEAIISHLGSELITEAVAKNCKEPDKSGNRIEMPVVSAGYRI